MIVSLHNLQNLDIICGICSIWVPAIVITFYPFFCHIFLELFFRLFLIFDYLPIIDQMPFSLLNHSFMTFHFFTILIKGISRGELLCNTTLILIGRCFISHWTLPPCPYFLSPILSNKESSLSFPILLRMISRLIPWKWCVGILFSLFFFWLLFRDNLHH